MIPNLDFFQVTPENAADYRLAREDGVPLECGFYWQSCSPGCLPDADPVGPFASEADAIEDAQRTD